MNKQSLARRSKIKNRSYANRGKELERLVDLTNRQYKNNQVASIHKIPTPVQITEVRGNRITGKLTKGELVDYVGIFESKAVVFDAKSTRGKSFPFDNLQEHQYNFLKKWNSHGAVSFLLVEFSEYQEIYFLPFDFLEKWYDEMKKGGRKSIPYTFFKSQCREVKSRTGYILDYLHEIEVELDWV